MTDHLEHVPEVTLVYLLGSQVEGHICVTWWSVILKLRPNAV